MLGRLALLLAAAVLVSACGGGGGGDGGGGGGGQDAYSLSSSSATFSATQGGTAPAPQTVLVTVNRGTVFIATSQSGSGFSHSFVITGQTTGQITITPDPPSTPGNFSGTITVRGCASSICSGNDVPGSPKIINVTYTVAGGPALTVAPSTIDFVTTPNNTPASQNVTLSLSSGFSPWSAMIVHTGGTAGWLTVSPMSGNLGASEVVTFSVNSAPLAPEVRTATVTFTAGSLTRVVPVSLTINSLGVNFVSPYVATTPVADANVIIRGYGFTGVTSVAFGTTPATTFTFVSDTEIRATLPALPTGTHAVNVTTGVLLPPRANLVVVNPPAFAAANISRLPGSGNATNLIYDAERQALFLMDPANNRIERYRFTGSWVADSLVVGVGGGNPRIALSPDGTELLKTSGNGTLLWRINPAAIPLALMSPPTNVDASSLLGTGANLNLIAFANDGSAVGSSFAPSTGITLYRYDMLNQTFTALSTLADVTNRTIVASGDGDTLALPTFEPLAPGFFKPVFTYDASTRVLTSHAAILTSQTEHASVSRDGSRMILVSSELSASQVTTVYSFGGGTLAALGNLPAGLTGFVITPDGSTAYAYFASPSPAIRKFNLNAPGFPETGAVAVASPGTFFNQMTISPDGGTLFLAGNQQVIIVPAP